MTPMGDEVDDAPALRAMVEQVRAMRGQRKGERVTLTKFLLARAEEMQWRVINEGDGTYKGMKQRRYAEWLAIAAPLYGPEHPLMKDHGMRFAGHPDYQQEWKP